MCKSDSFSLSLSLSLSGNRAAGNPKRRIILTTVSQWAESGWRNKYMYNSLREHRSEFAIVYFYLIIKGYSLLFIPYPLPKT